MRPVAGSLRCAEGVLLTDISHFPPPTPGSGPGSSMNAGDIIGSESIVVEDGGVRISQSFCVHSETGDVASERRDTQVTAVSKILHAKL